LKIARYFLVGGLAALVDILLFAVLVKGFDFGWLGSAAFSFCVATLVNYVLSVRHVFESGVRFGKRHEMVLVFAVSAIGLLINQAVLGMLIEGGGIDVLLSKVAATGSVFFWNYGARRHFIFRETVK
jgi:putative flippase GtrA